MKKRSYLSRAALMVGAGLMITSAATADAGDWVVRARALWIVPDESADITAIGGDVNINKNLVPEIDISYFFTDKIALEVVLATSKHRATAVDTALGDVPLGSVHLLPPSFVLQYHPLVGEAFSPYVGAGVNLTYFFSSNVPANGAVTSINYDNFSIGPVVQAGVDIRLTENSFLNFDVKKVWLSNDVSINGGAILADVDVDPWTFGIGIGTRF